MTAANRPRRSSTAAALWVLAAAVCASHLACGSEQPVSPASPQSLGFVDPNLDGAVRRALLKPPAEVIRREDVAGLTWLSGANLGISDLEGIQALSDLRQLDLSGNKIEDISWLSHLTSLRLLYLNGNRVRDVSAVRGMVSLSHLDLSGNDVEDLSPLSGLTSLALLYAGRNRIADVGALSGLHSLEILRIPNNLIEDIGPLQGLGRLVSINLAGNRVVDISPLAGLRSLWYLDLSRNEVADISVLVGNEGIDSFDTVSLAGNPLGDLALSSHIAALEARRVTVLLGTEGQ